MTIDRRNILKTAAAAAGLGVLPPALSRALAAAPRRGTGTIKDVEHVVIFMQENRSFDHYFGTLRGVRGFSDPRALRRADGHSVFEQPVRAGAKEFATPFHLDTKTTSAQVMASLDHSWKGRQSRWDDWDAWIETKSDLTMGYFTRGDIPFYYALADAFTICDAYHCSIFGPTNPNRLFLMTGTSGLGVGVTDTSPVVANPADEPNETANVRNDSPLFNALKWTTYPERLSKAGVSWKIYQEYDNYGDNALAYFEQFRAGAPEAALRQARSPVPGSNSGNYKQSRGEYLAAAFAEDVKHDTLAQVSWIVAPYIASEHPKATPGYGEALTAMLLEALASNPDVFAKTVFILNYDENDGFFDHMPAYVPPAHMLGGERFAGEPVGFGPRVPLIVVSPWTRGGFVNSQVSDHTSIIRFLEQRFGVVEPNISAWRRAVASDLTSMFDFRQPDGFPALPPARGAVAAADAQAKLPAPRPPAAGPLPRQEPGQRPARPLPYRLTVQIMGMGDFLNFNLANAGDVAVPLIVFGGAAGKAPRHMTIPPSTSTNASSITTGPYAMWLHGPHGLYAYASGDGPDRIDAQLLLNPANENLTLFIQSNSRETLEFTVHDAYAGITTLIRVTPREGGGYQADLPKYDFWYDLTLTGKGSFRRQFAGHWETGRPSRSDPLIGKG